MGVSPAILRRCWRSELRPFCLCGRHFMDWAISQALLVFSFPLSCSPSLPSPGLTVLCVLSSAWLHVLLVPQCFELSLGSSLLLQRVTRQLCLLITLLVRDLMCALLLANYGMQERFIYISPLNKWGWNNGAATSRDVKRKKTNNLIPYNHNVHPPHGQQLPH